MKASDFNVGDHIEWARKSQDGYLPKKDGEGDVIERHGRNILVDILGSNDWLYMPDLAWCRKIHE